MRYAVSTARQVRSCARNCRRRVLLSHATGPCHARPGKAEKGSDPRARRLPERRHPSGARGARSGRTSAAVTKRLVMRMEAATTMLAHISTEIAKTKIFKLDSDRPRYPPF